MKGSKFGVMVFALSVAVQWFVVLCSTRVISSACEFAYNLGGARGVLRDEFPPEWEVVSKLECPQREWYLQNESNREFATATIQGHRNYQEDRIVFDPVMMIPIPDAIKDWPKEVTIGIAAVFDGHGGAEASELASKKFLDYFFQNAIYKIYEKKFDDHPCHFLSIYKSSRGGMDMDTLIKSILKDALIKTFEDIDAEFAEEVSKNGYESGSTGTAVLLLNGQVLVGYVGDSKALLCSDPTRASEYAKGTSSRSEFSEELTIDHNPNREDEKARIEASGGFIRTLGVPRVNGILAMTRAIGDRSLKRYGVIAEPEVIGWRTLSGDNSFLVVGTDGIFEGLTPTNVCAILNNNACSRKNTSSSNSYCLTTLANYVVHSAFENGSTDNISVILIPLDSDNSSE